MAYDLSALRKAKQTYKATPSTPSTTSNRFTTPIQAISAATNMTPNKATPTAANAAQMMVTNTQPRTEQTLNNLQSNINNGFNYDRNTDPALQAAIRNAQQTVQDTQKNTYAGLRANGQGKSSYSETVAQQIGLKGAAEIENNLVPQYVQQAYQRYQDGLNNQSNLYGLQYQQDVTTPMNEAQLTGNYVPPAAQNAINGILALKKQAEATGTTAAQRTELSKQADGLRAQLQSLGIDPTKYGANVNSAAAGSTQQQGLRTLAGQAQDLNKQESQFNQGITTAQLTGTMPDGSKTTTEQQRQLTNLWTIADQTGTIPTELAKMYNLPEGTQTLAAKQFAQQLAISQQNADINAGQLNLSRDNAAWNQQTAIIDAQTKAQQAAAQTMTPQDYAKSYINPIAKRNDKGVVQNKNDVISAIGASGYDDAKIDTLLRQYGITDADVKAYQKAYGLGE